MKFPRYFLCLCFLLFLSGAAFAVDGTALINQSTALAGLGGCDTPGFPVTICQPGSYKLSGNLTVNSQTIDAIDVVTDNVTVDLNGFTLKGARVCTGTGVAISCTGDAFSPSFGVRAFFTKNLSIRNGSITGFEYGIAIEDGLLNEDTSNGLVEEVHVYSNAGNGMNINDSIVRRCTVSHNGYNGIQGYGAILESNLLVGNGNAGLSIGTGTTAISNVSRGNRYGVQGFNAIIGSNTFLDNNASFNTDPSLFSQDNNICGVSFVSVYKC